MTDLLLVAEPTTAGEPPAAGTPGRRPRRRRSRWRTWSAPSLLIAVVVLVAVALSAMAPGLFTSNDPLFGDSADRLLAPGLEHLFGTDQLGRDVFARFVHGTRASLHATLIAVGVAAGGGIALGLAAGFVGGAVDAVISRLVEVLLAIPGLLLSLTIIAALGFGTGKIGLAVGVAGIPSFARVMRAEVMRVRISLYVEAARTLGARTRALLTDHVLPQSIGPVAALAVLELASAVLAVSALSFLGFGSPPPAPEWGALVAEGRDYLATAWWLTILPGLAVALVVVCANRLARGIRGQGAAA